MCIGVMSAPDNAANGHSRIPQRPEDCQEGSYEAPDHGQNDPEGEVALCGGGGGEEQTV